MAQSSGKRTIKSVGNTCEMLRCLQNRGSATVSELSETSGLSPGTVHTHLATLKEYGLVRQEEACYSLGTQLVSLGKCAQNRSKLYQSSKREIDRVAAETGESVHLLVENRGESVFLYDAYGDDAVGTKHHIESQETPSNHMHCYASGKAILAHLPREERNRVLDQIDFSSLTSKTITSRRELEQVLETVKSRGYAINDEEEIRGIRAVGVPILNDQVPIGAVSISGPRSRFQDEKLHDTLSETVTTLSNVIELNYKTKDLSIK